MAKNGLGPDAGCMTKIAYAYGHAYVEGIQSR